MQPSDIPSLARLMAGDPLWQRYGVTEESAARRLAGGLEQAATILVADEDGACLGFVWYVGRGAFARSGYIMLIGVQPGARSRGVGRALVARAEAAMFAGVDDIFLLVSDFNEPAQRFYQGLGYTQVGSIPDYVVPGITELIYRKRREGPAAPQS